jgi:hypothetical protein
VQRDLFLAATEQTQPFQAWLYALNNSGKSSRTKRCLRSGIFRNARGLATDAIWRRMIQHNGRLRSSKWLPSRLKVAFANRYAIMERTEIALTVASMYAGGDYFEFGSESFTTFRNFLTAFDLNTHIAGHQNTRFFAFDVFGDVDAGRGFPQQDS